MESGPYAWSAMRCNDCYACHMSSSRIHLLNAMNIFRCTFILCTFIHLNWKPTLKMKLVNRISSRRNGRKDVYTARMRKRIHPHGADTITIYPCDCMIEKSCGIFTCQFQCTLNLRPEPKNMKWQAQRALHLQLFWPFSSLKVDEISIVGTAAFGFLIISRSLSFLFSFWIVRHPLSACYKLGSRALPSIRCPRHLPALLSQSSNI